MIVETRACIVGRLLEISRELKRLKDMPLPERQRLSKSLRVERRQLLDGLFPVSQMYEVRNDSH